MRDKNKMSCSDAGKLGQIASAKTRAEQKQARIDAYNANPKCCAFCDEVLSYSENNKKFCNRSCSAKFNNKITKNKFVKKALCPCGKIKNKKGKFCSDCITNKQHLHFIHDFEKISCDSVRRRFLLRTCPHQCEICKETQWQGQPIPLIMDHIDGDSTNNVRSNFRLVCPNCDAQLPTYKAKNKGKGRHSRRERYKEGKSF